MPGLFRKSKKKADEADHKAKPRADAAAETATATATATGTATVTAPEGDLSGPVTAGVPLRSSRPLLGPENALQGDADSAGDAGSAAGDAGSGVGNEAATEAGTVSVGELEKQVVETLKTIFDPEIPVNIYELGLIYTIDVTHKGAVDVKMTLTAPGCPVAFSMPGEIEAKILSIPAVQEAKVTVVWEPPWNKDMMSEAAKLQLGFW
ncbi:MAG: SUF system Fe-S cluster assembly protein [Candidatus Sericytochromatia bacterium]|uniref:SUF system Fe-S cluster assembly protein n=1 Tax=Candidatus Tanganyikabacteria bacterium TaxID=2961651 RepID=A0A937X614_9BACT|nr:SUF system Fe-S cluster assembly protein [Candidatus Tanganyikabacteria bacterium]